MLRVEGGYVEDVKSVRDIKVKVKEEDMVKVSSDDSLDIKKIEDWGEVNIRQWEKEI